MSRNSMLLEKILDNPPWAHDDREGDYCFYCGRSRDFSWADQKRINCHYHDCLYLDIEQSFFPNEVLSAQQLSRK